MKQSAGILLYRLYQEQLQFFLVHPGGPFFQKKDEGYWTIPKGEVQDGEAMLAAAIREFEEETGHVPQGPFKELGFIKQKGGKQVFCWAAIGELDVATLKSNTFELEWPPRSGKMKTFPEIDKSGWFEMEEACRLINEMQRSFLEAVYNEIR